MQLDRKANEYRTLFNVRDILQGWLTAVLIALASGCATGAEPPEAAPSAAPAPLPAADDAPGPDRPVILAYGDSLTAGHMVDAEVSYPAQLQRELDRRGYEYRVVNQGISGDTTSGGLARLPGALALDPAIVILELGGNDGLRGVPIEVAEENLGKLITAFDEQGARVILAGLTLPRNYGPDYIGEFETMYVELAERHGIDRIPFFLEGVAGIRELNLSDGIHPTGEGYAIVASTVFEAIEPYLEK